MLLVQEEVDDDEAEDPGSSVLTMDPNKGRATVDKSARSF